MRGKIVEKKVLTEIGASFIIGAGSGNKRFRPIQPRPGWVCSFDNKQSTRNSDLGYA